MVKTGQWTLLEVQDGLRDPPEGRRYVGRPSRCSGTDRETSQMSRTGWGILREVQEGSGDPPRGQAWVG